MIISDEEKVKGKKSVLRGYENLKEKSFGITGPKDDTYNCFAWAVHEENRNWNPDKEGEDGYYWPDGIAKDGKLESCVQAFETEGYERCDNGTLECGYEKIAIYARSGEVKHVARLLPTGKWTSKLGTGYRIEHAAVEDLEQSVLEMKGDGSEELVPEKVVAYMKRPQPSFRQA